MTEDRNHSHSDPHASPTKTVAPQPPVPKIIGGHRVLHVLGEGGMGIVYEAEQQHPRRPVALKVVRGGHFVDDHHVRLFQREAQTLARLKHPCIAAIYDAGRTDDGQHFFAMELVRGIPLMQYVESKGLSTRDRLDLFRKICDAINYAHQRGIIHRDLKPSNVLIDGDGRPKILDFGLAKMTDADIAVTTVVTELGKIQGTLPYMSPEQARGNPDEIDLRSDVYSLGVILYELLTGQLPYDVTRAMLHEAVRVICEEVPRKPSTINRTLRGDVETIALKALEKEPSRRYQSASGLSDDVERYLTNQPILARRPSAMYQFKKLIARHKLPFAFAITLFLLLLGFAAAMTHLYRQSEARLKVAKRFHSDLVDTKRKFADLYEADGEIIKANELRHEATLASQEILIFEPGNPIAEGALLAERRPPSTNPAVRGLYESAMFYASNKKWAEGEENFQRALQLDHDNVPALLGMAWMKLEQNRENPNQAGTEAWEAAESYASRALSAPINLEDSVKALGYQGVALRRLKKYPQAIASMRRSLELNPAVYYSWTNLGLVYAVTGNLDQAERCLREGATRAGSDQDKWHAAAWRNLATFELFQHKSEAAQHITKALEAYDEDVLAWVIQTRIRLELADHLNVRKALDDAKYANRKGNSRNPKAKRALALAHLRNNEFDDAVIEARAAIALKDMPTVNHLVIAVAEAKRGQAVSAKETLAAAESAWPEQLRKPGDFSASAETGELWIESADDLLRLRAEAETAIAVVSGSQP